MSPSGRDFPPRPAGCCAVCRNQETGVGYSPPRARAGPITWTCDAHIDLARTVHHMPQPHLDRTQWTALRAAGDQAGAYLEEIGRSDLATLTAEEWETFLAIFLDQYGQSMSAQLRAGSAPF